MNPRFRSFARAQPGPLLAGALGLLLAGCRHDYVVVPAADNYFPTVVGTYRSYAVQDSTWTNGKVSVSQYQLRERVSEQYADAAGQPAYRLVRSRRATASQAWVDDSAFVVQPLPQALTVTRGNVRTIELIYPVRANQGWNATAFGADTTAYLGVGTSYTRYYGPSVGTAATVPAVPGAPAQTYEATVYTKATLLPAAAGTPGQEDIVNVYMQRGLRQLYARGVGLVLRRRFYYETFTTAANGSQTLTPGAVQNGYARRETLLETGTI